MNVRLLELSSLIPVTIPPSRSADRLSTNSSLLGAAIELTAPPFGAFTLRCTGVSEPAPPDDADALWALSRAGDGRLGYLLLPALTALRILAGALGIPAPSSLRPLGASERGIVTAVIAGVLRAAAIDGTVVLGTRSWRASGLVRLMLTARAHRSTWQERFSLDLPADWVSVADDPSWLSDATRRGLEIPLTLRVAQTTLTISDWAGAQVGDAVVFDDSFLETIPSGGSWKASLDCGLFRAQLTVAPDGIATLLTDFEPTRTELPTGDTSGISHEENAKMSANESPNGALTMLAAAPVEVVAEVGRISMRADEVAALRTGSIVVLGSLGPRTVELRVGSRIWAQGELVEVEGKLGVRLTSLSSGADPAGSPGPPRSPG